MTDLLKLDFDVVVVGAGVIGASCALLLALKKPEWRIAVVERANPLTSPEQCNAKVLALGQVAQTVLTNVGVFAQLSKQSCYPYTAMNVWDENSEGHLTFTAKEQGLENLGHMVDAQQCAFLLQQQMQAAKNISCLYQQDPSSLTLESGRASLVTKEHNLRSRLVIAADGARSWARNQVKIFAGQVSYSQFGLVAKIKSELSHQDSAWQRFLSDGPLAVLPLDDNYSSIVWTVDEQQKSELTSLSKQGFELRLSEAFEYKLGKMALHSDLQAFELNSQQAERYFTRNFVLIGDAAHSIHPLAGQGANLGFKDIVALVDVLKTVQKDKLGELQSLQRFERKRKSDNLRTDFFMTALNEAYKSQFAWWPPLRSRGMNFVSNSKWLKAMLASQATGK